jgi:glycerate kinase
MRRYVVAPDSFKGTMSSIEICNLIEQTILESDPDARVDKVPVADGGEGLVDAYLSMCGGKRIETRVTGPLFEPVDAFFGMLEDGETAIVEMAAAAGLPLLTREERNPEKTTTIGVGELILQAIKAGAKKIILGLGGSATNDGGIGMAYALGFRFFDASGKELSPVGGNLIHMARIESPAEKLIPQSIIIEAACDVNNLLYGIKGAAFIFGPQKGADSDMIDGLDKGLMNFADRLENDLGAQVRQIPGGGAAGGLGAGVVAFLGGTLRPGIELLLDTIRFDELVSQADYVFTGEGRMDGQSLSGKTPVGVAMRAQRFNVPVIGIVGSLGKEIEPLYAVGFTTIISTIRDLAPIEEILKTCREDLVALVKSIVRLIVAKKN